MWNSASFSFASALDFVRELLHAVLAKQSLARVVRLDDCSAGKVLLHGHQRDIARDSTGALGGTRDAVVDDGKVSGDGHRKCQV